MRHFIIATALLSFSASALAVTVTHDRRYVYDTYDGTDRPTDRTGEYWRSSLYECQTWYENACGHQESFA